MSASKEKKNRIEQTDGLSKKAAAAAEQAKKDKAFRVKTIIALAVIVVVVAAALLVNSNLFYTHTGAVQVGSTRYSPAEVDFFYKSSFNKLYEYYYSQLGSSISMLLDTSKPLNEQNYSNDQTWADYIFETAQNDMKQITVYYDAAMKAGYTLNDEDRATVDNNVAQMYAYAESNKFPSLDKFLAVYFGKGMNEKLYTELNEKVAIANRYSQDLMNSLTYTDEELEAYYVAHADEMNAYDYYLYAVSTSDDRFADLDDAAKADAAHAAAEEVAKADSVDEFIANVKAVEGEDYSLSMTQNSADAMGSSYKDWVTDPARKAGDTTVVDIDSFSYALAFVGLNDNRYYTTSMRHILVMVDTDEDGNYTEEAKADALDRLEGIRGDWELLGADEDSFANLANQYSEDGGSNTNGGLYTDITMGQMVPVVNDFLFAEGRQVGDTDIVFNDGSYVGWHLLYFAGSSELNHRQELAKNAMSSADYNDKYEALSAGYDVKVLSGAKFANLT